MTESRPATASGFLVSLEGGEGAGKSTVLAAITDRLAGIDRELVVTREPGGTPAGERIRELLLDPGHSLFAETELLLMFASRAQLVRETVMPALARGAIVVSDRFTDASFAYQGGGRGLEGGCIAELERWAAVVRPDLTFLLDVEVAEGLARARSRGEAADRIESEREAFFERVRVSYRRRATDEPDRFRVIDASQSPGRVRRDVLAALDARLAEAGLA